MRKRKLRFFICAIIQLSVSVFFFFAAAFVSGDLKNHTPSAIELYDTKGLNISEHRLLLLQDRGDLQQGNRRKHIGYR